MNLKIYLKKQNFVYIIYLPLLFNFLLNLFKKINENSIVNLNFYDLIVSILLSISLCLIGYQIKNLTRLPYLSSGIVVYFLSFFIFDNLVLFFYQEMSFNNVFYTINILWILVLAFKKFELKKLFLIFFNFLLIGLISNQFFLKLTSGTNIIGDVKDIHYLHVANIFQTSFYYSINNPSLEGYPQLVAYIHALLHKFIIFNNTFTTVKSASNVFLFLTLVLFMELDLNKSSKIIISIVYSVIIFNSEWLKFLFLDSLMTEGVLAYLITVFTVSISKLKYNDSFNKNLLFFCFGFLVFSKQFISLISLIVVILFVFLSKFKVYSLLGLIGVLVKELSFVTYFRNIIKNYHLRDVDVVDLVFDLLLLRDLKYSNLNIILKNLFFDKPIFIVFTYFFILLIIYLFIFKIENFEINLFTFVILLNLSFVVVLYISIWKNMELESPIRYLLNFLVLKLIFQFKVIEKVMLKFRN